MNLTLDIETYAIGSLALGALFAAVYALWQWSRVARLKKFVRCDSERDYLSDDSLPSVSVVVYAHDDAPWLERNLPALLAQRYAAEYEVIVVDDGSWDNSGDVVSGLMAADSRLRLTFTPHEARGLSRKKLSLMIGIKAARHDVEVITDANCEPAGEDWLQKVARNFVDGVDVVVGYSHPCYQDDKGLWRRYRVWDTVRVGAQYVCSAVKGHVYRGTSHNLAFRRKLFFDRGGYARSAGLKWGEDDVWLRSVVKSGNSRVELSADSMVTAHYDNCRRAYKELKLRRDFTSRFVRRKQFVVQGFMSWINYLRVAALAVAAVLAILAGNWWLLGATVLVWICAIVSNVMSYNAMARLLQAPALYLNVPLLTLWTPLVNLRYRITGIKARKSYYTMTLE
ncbi:MAG: glycosyltransferase [Muribaculaceae bacterium]|nr:glycosyltransferase [Muribaculaceae bacterium]